MNRDLFIKAIDALEKQMKYDISVAEKLGEAFPNTHNANLLYDNHYLHNMIIEILQEAMNDKVIAPKVECSWIEHFCYELDFGKENWRLKVFDNLRNEIPLKSPEDLYNILVGSKSNIERFYPIEKKRNIPVPPKNTIDNIK